MTKKSDWSFWHKRDRRKKQEKRAFIAGMPGLLKRGKHLLRETKKTAGFYLVLAG